MVIIYILKRKMCPKSTSGQQLSSKVSACTYPSLRTGLDHSSSSKGLRERKWSHKAPGEGQTFGRTNTSVLTTDTENLSPCWYNWGMHLRGSQSPHPASGNRPSWPECLSFHSSLHTAGQSLTSLRAQELLLLEPWSHRTYHKAAQLKLLMSISGFGTVFAATTPKTTLFQGLKQVRQMIHTHMCFQTLLTSSCLKLLPGRRHLFI